MKVLKDIQLAPYTTFKLGGPARFFCSAATEADLVEAVQFARSENVPVFVLGGGSNILISDNGFPGLVIHMEQKGIVYDEAKEILAASAGEMWDAVVEYAVSRGLHGIENLSAIPGTAGAAPVQNIGAYGADASDVITLVRALDTATMQFVELSNAECRFVYRDSLFKHEKGRYIVTRVDMKLTRAAGLNLTYRDVQKYFAGKDTAKLTIEDVRKAIIDIRWGKLPDWKLWGTAGSYFKNPVVAPAAWKDLQARYPGIVGFPEEDGRTKVSLGWIIDQVCGMKGWCLGEACTYEKQALVVIAKPGATSEQVVGLAREVMDRVKDKTGISIEGEVEWVM